MLFSLYFCETGYAAKKEEKKILHFQFIQHSLMVRSFQLLSAEINLPYFPRVIHSLYLKKDLSVTDVLLKTDTK